MFGLRVDFSSFGREKTLNKRSGYLGTSSKREHDRDKPTKILVLRDRNLIFIEWKEYQQACSKSEQELSKQSNLVLRSRLQRLVINKQAVVDKVGHCDSYGLVERRVLEVDQKVGED